jgi:diguanylate cyclase (GGDEF)-like protein
MLDVGTLTDGRRMNALDRYDILDTPPEEGFDRITRLVRRVFGVDFATVTFLDGHRQWFKSRQGLSASESSGQDAFCRISVAEGRPLIVPDTLADARFCQSPLVLGEPYLRFYAGFPLRGSDRQFIGTICAMDVQPREFGKEQLDILADLARLVETELELRLLATTDYLTGALSRRAFRQEVERAIALAVRNRHELSCIAFDLDHFKAINDEHGHTAGDTVLRSTVESCMGQLRKYDLLGRLGGEEFAVLLPHAGLTEACTVAEKLRSAIEQQAGIGTSSPDLRVAASFGIAAIGPSCVDIDALLEHADKALYAAKEGGRNRCVAYAPGGLEAAGRRVLKGGKIAFNGGRSVIDCTVRRLSGAGARLEVISSTDIPTRFKLQIEADDFSRACEIVEKTDRNLEIVFC